MIRRPPRSTRTDTLFPSRRSSDLIRDESVCHYVRRPIHSGKGIKVVQPPCPQKYGYSPKILTLPLTSKYHNTFPTSMRPKTASLAISASHRCSRTWEHRNSPAPSHARSRRLWVRTANGHSLPLPLPTTTQPRRSEEMRVGKKRVRRC